MSSPFKKSAQEPYFYSYAVIGVSFFHTKRTKDTKDLFLDYGDTLA
jgi:hypothetical protein